MKYISDSSLWITWEELDTLYSSTEEKCGLYVTGTWSLEATMQVLILHQMKHRLLHIRNLFKLVIFPKYLWPGKFPRLVDGDLENWTLSVYNISENPQNLHKLGSLCINPFVWLSHWSTTSSLRFANNIIIAGFYDVF